ncbi:MAG: EF-Tu/IF-2/RF-3 family GTPase [Planctomycetales bacterium]
MIDRKLLAFDEEDKGKTIRVSDIPKELQDEAELWRSRLIEQLADYSDEVMSLLLEEEEVPTDLIHETLRSATLISELTPVLCGSALHYIGVQPVLDAVGRYLPSPADKPPVEGANLKKTSKKSRKNVEETIQRVTRKPSLKEPFCGLVFKVVAEKHGDLFFIRVYSGELKGNSRVHNPRAEQKENISQLWRIQSDNRTQVPSVGPGEIVGVMGLKYSVTSDTLCDPKHPIALESIVFPETVVSMAIEPETSGDRKKLADVMERLQKQDPTFQTAHEDSGRTIISGMGELHLEIIKHRLLRDFNLNVRVHKPQVSFRESVAHAATVSGECQRQIAGQELSAAIQLRMEPFEDPEQSVAVESELPDDLPEELAETVLEALTEEMQGGGLGGNPLMKLKLTAVALECGEQENQEMAVRMAVRDGFSKALQEGGPVLLEPIMKVEVSVPDEHVGDVISDLQRRRGDVVGQQHRGRMNIVDAKVPLNELWGYSDSVRSVSSGLANHNMEPCGYAPAPAEIREKFL